MKNEKIALFGGTGRTGIPFLKHAVERYKVNVLVRDPAKLSFSHPNMTVLTGDILQLTDVENTIKEADVAVSLIGHSKGSPPDLQSRGIENIISAMKKNGTKRLISLTGGGVRNEETDRPEFIDHMFSFIMKNLAGKETRNTLEDGQKHAEIIRNTDLDWTIVRAPMLTTENARHEIEVGNVGTIKGFKLTREDLALFILGEIENNNHIKKMPFVTNG